jgi:hypothetical protein
MPEIGTYSLSGGRRLARQRASSDPTNIVLLAASCTLELCHQQQRNLMRREQHAKPLQGSRITVGWISRKNLLRSRRSFVLDIPFFRTHRGLGPLHGEWSDLVITDLLLQGGFQSGQDRLFLFSVLNFRSVWIVPTKRVVNVDGQDQSCFTIT